jgi:hypothetical protein
MGELAAVSVILPVVPLVTGAGFLIMSVGSTSYAIHVLIRSDAFIPVLSQEL